MYLQDLKIKISDMISETIKREFDFTIDEIELEIPKNFKNGHLTTNAALIYSKKIGLKPQELAKKIVENLQTDLIEKVEMAGPGFINISLSDQTFKEFLEKMNETSNYGQKEVTGEKILLEYLSANPTGDLHLGHARQATFGDSLARILKYSGHDVNTEYYINDAGKQITNLGLSIRYFYLENLGIESEFPEDGYRGQDIKRVADKLYSEVGAERKDEEVEYFREYGRINCLEEIKLLVRDLNIHFDNWQSETELYETNAVERVLNVLSENDMTYEKEGAIWLKTQEFYDDKDRVIVKTDKTLTYLTPDIAYHLNKFDRGYQKLINIFGGDHHGYVPRLESAVGALGHDKDDIEVIIVQMISVLENNKAVKMSKRKGTSVTIRDLLARVDVEVLRYFFVHRSPDTQLDFDIAVAEEESANNPIYYIQYAHVRIESILQKAEELNLTNKVKQNYSDLEKEIAIKMSLFPETVYSAAVARQPHRISNYVYDLASLYHKYYAAEKVFTDNQEVVEEKLYFMVNIQKIIKTALDLLGIKAKKEM